MNFQVSSECCSKKIDFEIPLLKWEDCNTLGKKIGYVAGRSINYVVSSAINLSSKAAKVLHLNEVTQFFKKTIRSACNTAYNSIEKVARSASKAIRSVFVNDVTKKMVNWTYDNVVTPLNNTIKKVANSALAESVYNGYCKVKQATRSALNFLCTEGKKALKTLADWTIIPLYNKVLSPVGKRINSFASNCLKCSKPTRVRRPRNPTCCQKSMQKLVDWTVVPLYNRVLSPIGTTLKDIGYGLISGSVKPKEEKKEEEKNVSKS